jgi:TRAP-type C4-dicarboxylate transport system permease small subunit
MSEGGAGARAMRILSIVGGLALMTAMATDVISVIGRQTGWPLIGSIELVQAAVVISAATGMIVATIARSHAVVHVLVNRLDPAPKRAVLRVSRLAAALMFAALAAGAAWSLAAHWGGHEESELLGIPYTPLRMVLVSACVVIAAIFAWQAWEGDSE